MSDLECYHPIEEIVRVYTQLGADTGDRHDGW